MAELSYNLAQVTIGAMSYDQKTYCNCLQRLSKFLILN